MIIVAVALIGVAIVACTGADLRRMVDLPVRHLWLVWAALGIQVGVLSVLGKYVGGTVGDVVHLATYAIAAAFVLVNFRVPGVPIMALGGAMNLTAIIANGGVMPASAAAWRIAGHADKEGFANSMPIAHPKLLPLGDVFAIPAGWPLANVFSVGDLLLVLGLMWMVHRWCRRPLVAVVPDDVDVDAPIVAVMPAQLAMSIPTTVPLSTEPNWAYYLEATSQHVAELQALHVRLVGNRRPSPSSSSSSFMGSGHAGQLRPHQLRLGGG